MPPASYVNRRGSLGGMPFGPDVLRGAPVGGAAGGLVDFRLARNAVLKQFKKGRLSRLDVCDAHPELLRAAQHVAEETVEECPVCEDAALVHVTYVFGSRLPPSGRCISSQSELAKLNRGSAELKGYTVEVCPACSWNHLIRMFPVGGRAGK